MKIKNANWITIPNAGAEVVPVFRRTFRCTEAVKAAWLEITAAGVYEAELNGRRVGDFVLAPGWTEYKDRLQVQHYNVTGLLGENNVLDVTVAPGWFRRNTDWWKDSSSPYRDMPATVIALLHIRYADGHEQLIPTDESWTVGRSNILVSGIYDGETVDARILPGDFGPVALSDYTRETLIPQQGPRILEQETLAPVGSFRTPKGEWVVDFGQNLTGYMSFSLCARAGEQLVLSTAEILDGDGNFYTENYRAARSRMEYICREGYQSYKPRFTFFGFRYLRIDAAPEGFDPACLKAIVVHSDMRRTGWLETSDPLLAQLFRNIVWGQKGNFLDVPTDCPQRDERLGWTGDAEVFVRTAAYNFDVRRFFRKWLTDLRCAQAEDGYVPVVIPNVGLDHFPCSAAWGDAAVICPWQLYQTYGDVSFLDEQFDSMCRWVDYIGKVTTTPDLWTGGDHYGDWLGLDSPFGSYKGSTDEAIVATAYYANSADLVVKAGHILGRSVEKYEKLHGRIVAAFQKTFGDRLNTQTEKVLALEFGLTDQPQALADALAAQVAADGTRMKTGFVGTPYILRVLSRYGYTELAYSLLLRKDYPSWLYPVTRGATTIWEHWDGIRPDNTLWSPGMNSFNHYAYGAVADWVYEYACGIQSAAPGFARVVFAPHADARIGSLSARLDTVRGEIYSGWYHVEGRVRYEIRTPVPADICINGETRHVKPGTYVFG